MNLSELYGLVFKAMERATKEHLNPKESLILITSGGYSTRDFDILVEVERSGNNAGKILVITIAAGRLEDKLKAKEVARIAQKVRK